MGAPFQKIGILEYNALLGRECQGWGLGSERGAVNYQFLQEPFMEGGTNLPFFPFTAIVFPRLHYAQIIRNERILT
jgi:hypothetical protein